MKEINLTKGKVAIVDDEDYASLSKHKWHFGNGYPRRSGENHVPVFIHRELMNPPKGMQVDHINGNTLDNRRDNLRIVTSQQNRFNMKIKDNPSKTSKYKGVSWCRRYGGVWTAQIKINNKSKGIGRFKKEEDAANAYNVFAKKYFGEYARLNDVPFNEDWESTLFHADPRGGSRYWGVSLHRRTNKWRVTIQRNKRQISLGYYDTEKEAAIAYNEYVKINGGNRINIIS